MAQLWMAQMDVREEGHGLCGAVQILRRRAQNLDGSGFGDEIDPQGGPGRIESVRR